MGTVTRNNRRTAARAGEASAVYKSLFQAANSLILASGLVNLKQEYAGCRVCSPPSGQKSNCLSIAPDLP